MSSKYDYNRTYCELCGDLGAHLSEEAWWTCSDHFRTPKPGRPLFNSRTGEPIGWSETTG